MSLEDSPKIPTPDLEKGDKVVTLAPDKGFTIIPDELYIFNHNQRSISFYISILPGDYTVHRKEAYVINMIPSSRRDDLAPPDE